MELSVNMLVVIIIAILVLGMGMTIMYQVFEQSGKLTNRLSAQQEQALKQLVISGEKVAVYPIVQDAEGRQGVFGYHAIYLHAEADKDQRGRGGKTRPY